MSVFEPPVFELWINDVATPFIVVALRGREALSRPYRFDVTALVARGCIDDVSLTGRRAVVVLRDRKGTARRVHGVVSAHRVEGHPVRNDLLRVRVRVVPRLALLRHRKGSRIYQQLSVPIVVRRTLERSRVELRAALDGRYKPSEYCVQYRETDLDFVHRLLAEIGAFYYFEQVDDEGAGPGCARGTERLVIADRAAHYRPLDGEAGGPTHLLFGGEIDDGDTPADVVEFDWGRRVRPTVVRQRGYDHINPLAPFDAAVGAELLDAALEREADGVVLSDYQHHDAFLRPGLGVATARVSLERHQHRVARGHGTGLSALVVPGHTFELEGHPLVELDRSYAVTEVTHEGRVPEAAQGGESVAVYRNRFGCLPANWEHRPAFTPGRVQQSMETATVVGPPGEEVHTDEHGRVKVRFNWDRARVPDAERTCWLRVMQAWGGAAFGAMFIPRVGMEVLVGFLEGDTDRPMVLGCLYNGSNPPPFPLPFQKTRSGIRTNTVGGEGFNELAFEDQADAELVHLRAQRDHELWAGRDRSAQTGRDDHLTVGRNETREVGGTRDDHVHGAVSERFDEGRTTEVRGDDGGIVGGNLTRRVAGDVTVQAAGTGHERYGGALRTTVGGEHTAMVRGAHTALVGRHDAKRAYTLHVDDRTQFSCTGTTTVTADKELTLRCGTSSVRLTPTAIEITADTVMVQGKGTRVVLGDDKIRLKAKDKIQVLGDSVVLKSSGASVGLTSEAAIDGSRVLIKSPASATDPVQDPTVETTSIELVDQDGRPMAYQRFRLTFGDGTEYTGVLDQDGKADVEFELGTATATFPDAGAAIDPG